jgi:hypothetical protein
MSREPGSTSQSTRPLCRQCEDNAVEPDRQSWATPVCKGCLPDCRHRYCSDRRRKPNERGYGRCEVEHEKNWENGGRA